MAYTKADQTGGSKADRKKKKRAAVSDALWACYIAVDARDGGRCRVCGAPATDHHHLRERSLGGKHTTKNVLAVCRRCHGDFHSKRLVLWVVSPDGADRAIKLRVVGGTESYLWV